MSAVVRVEGEANGKYRLDVPPPSGGVTRDVVLRTTSEAIDNYSRSVIDE
jgi:hypothetical protein